MSEEMTCTAVDCDKTLTEKVYNYSMEKHGAALCFDHQQQISEKKNGQTPGTAKKVADKIAPPVKKENSFGNESPEEINNHGKKIAEELKTTPPKEVGVPYSEESTYGITKDTSKGLAQQVFNTLKKLELELEKKGNFNYASWSLVWEKIKTLYPLATFKAYENGDGMPYFASNTGGMVKVGVTIDGLEHIQWHPIINYNNKSIPIATITTMDINTSIQRAMVKACALHGLGLYVYQGEDLPKEE